MNENNRRKEDTPAHKVQAVAAVLIAVGIILGVGRSIINTEFISRAEADQCHRQMASQDSILKERAIANKESIGNISIKLDNLSVVTKDNKELLMQVLQELRSR